MYYEYIYIFYVCVHIQVCAQLSWLGEKEININNGFQKHVNLP